MEFELIDYYDENGNHKGVIDKSIAHKEGLWHKSVHVWMLNDKNQVLLQKRCSDKKLFPNFWDCSFAGHIGAGESSLISALREGEEELGLHLKENELQYLFTVKEEFVYNDINSKEFVDVYLVRKNVKIEELKYQKEEVETAAYFDMKDLFNNKISNLISHDEEYKLLKKVI